MKAQVRHSRNDVLRLIAANQLPWLIRKDDVNNDIVIGMIGERGSTKSVSAGTIAANDHMVSGETCWSNMSITYETKIDKSLTMPLGISPGKVKYQSEELDIVALLEGSTEYHDGIIVVDEINIALADGRRSMSNQNLMADDIIQLLRKMNSGFIYTCIHEMFVDNRIRDNTDIFIRCKDNKFNPARWGEDQKQGSMAEWHIHAMTDKGAYILQRVRAKDGYVGRWLFAAEEYWGIIDTDLKQKRKKHAVRIGHVEGDIETKENAGITAFKKDWDWLEEKVLQAGSICTERGTNYLKSGELSNIVGHALDDKIRKALQAYGVNWNTYEQAYGVGV